MGTGIYLKRFSGTIAALVIFALLLAGIFFFKEKEDKESVRTVFPNLGQEQVLSIMLKSQGSETNLDLDDGKWLFASTEEKGQANQAQVLGFIDEVKRLELVQTVSSEQRELTEFGLQEPVSEFLIITDRGEYYLLIGDKNPSGTGTYVYDIDRERLMITRSEAASKLIEYSGRDFKDRKVIAISPPLVNRVMLRVGNFFTVLQKNEGVWTADPLPEGLSFDHAKAEELLTALAEIEINDVVNSEPENPEEYGFDLPSAEIEIFQNGGSYKMLIGKRRNEEEHYIKFDKDPTIYSTSKENFKKLPKKVEDITE